MKKQIFLLSTVLWVAGCSPSKYTYKFDSFDYNSGRKKAEKSFVQNGAVTEISPLTVTQEDLSGSVSPMVASPEKEVPLDPEVKEKAKRYKDMSKGEKKVFKKEIKKQIKTYAKEMKAGNSVENIEATNALDNDLKLAIIFGAVGITLTVLGGVNTVFWVLGVISLVIGLVFFIQWISRQ